MAVMRFHFRSVFCMQIGMLSWNPGFSQVVFVFGGSVLCSTF